ncbi:MAG: hypothetical protein QOG13_3168 [Sphingomonadales bacterium]|jgi:hypothetical protein|nr:hypothetical protein [Sphingomonadales bacterium]
MIARAAASSDGKGRRPKPGAVAAGSPFGAGPATDHREEFLRAHYLLIADHATQLSRTRWTYVQLSLAAVAIFYSALFSTETRLGRSDALYWLLALPVALSVFGAAQAFAIRRAIDARNDLLVEIEDHYEFKGWAHSVRAGWTTWKHPFDHLVYLYWAFLFTFTSLFGYAVHAGWLAIPQGG